MFGQNIKYLENILNINTFRIIYLNFHVKMLRILSIFTKVFNSIVMVCRMYFTPNKFQKCKIVCKFRYNLCFFCNIQTLSLHRHYHRKLEVHLLLQLL